MTSNDASNITLQIFGVNSEKSRSEVEIQLKFCDFPYICRLCLQRTNDLECIHDISIENTQMSTVLVNEYKLKMDKEQLPPNMCKFCKNRIIDAFQLKQQSARSEQALKTLLQIEDLREIEVLNENEIKEELPSDPEYEDEKDTSSTDETNLKYKPITDPKNKPKSAPRIYKCPICEQEFNQRDYRLHRLETGHTNTCKICHREFKKRTDLDRHLERHKRDSGSAVSDYQCDICLKRFFLASSMNHHKKMHGVEPSFVCECCGRRFKNKLALESHLLSHRNGTIGSMECSLCKQRFNNESAVTLHMFHMHREYSESRKGRDHKCEVCNRGFFRKSTLTRHMLMHKTDNRTYLCNECGKQFANQMLLNAHIKLHSNVAAFPCPVCGKAFTQVHYMRRHLKSHADTRLYQCEICNKSFKYENRLRHKLSHSGVKPHSCKVCGKSFSRKNILTIHLRTHTGDLPFKCDLCEQRFADPGVFSKHKKVHERSKDVN